MTVNVSVLLLVIVGILFFGECPLNPVQLLWVNLIMDTFAAIALSTEPPMEKILRTPPTSNASILTAPIWRQVLGVSIWQFLIILTLYIMGDYIGGFEADFSYYGDKLAEKSPDDKCEDTSTPGYIKGIIANDAALAAKCKKYWGAQMKLRLFTYVLCTFVFMQVFNYINCRKIGQNEVNVFERLFTKINWYFWFTIGFITLVQISMVQIFWFMTRTTPLTRSEWGACVVAGSTVLLIAALLKMTGSRVLKKIPFTKFIDEDKEAQDGLVNAINKYSNVQVNVNVDALKRKKKKPKGDTDEVADDEYER